jgi:hypothetical protein
MTLSLPGVPNKPRASQFAIRMLACRADRAVHTAVAVGYPERTPDCRPPGCHLHTARMKALRRTWPTNAPTSHRDRSDRSRCPSPVAAPLIAPQSGVKPLSRPGPLRYRYGSWREHRDEEIKRDSVGRAPSWHADRPPAIKALHRPPAQSSSTRIAPTSASQPCALHRYLI